jgi:hypothetical protein
MIDSWLTLSIPTMFLAVGGFYSVTAALLYWLCFGRRTRAWMLTFNGAVAELFGAIMVIFGILIGFVAGDVWIAGPRRTPRWRTRVRASRC